ncbi:GNAT family N-acetyltransferase [Clavibacter sepedonicus]|uniref:Acetyltranferase n=1 Tax=Clavibacter sepedonicus TaxID=31964 RepID=B0RC82_CLASE|nr:MULTISPECIES: GNAT family protein [Clavibacter]MBD5381421.1 GNAT family N-acetyltransferase [Clavibacter sp.]OQJ48482.1 N-acetyltransferase [Clavibacter sepedonicus]OQJ53963.1 N-acetyltransferase [Clavibacter sepedonicus]UUK65488.1 GNAT family N-acetyltransferase [Clavibacter sepedonicus]CAQ02968.1 putative acetyltranferase [Clavibacter sepedonicus]
MPAIPTDAPPAPPAVELVPVDVERDREALRAFLTSNAFPFHVRPAPTTADVDARIADGDFQGPEHEALWVEVAGSGRVGLVVLDDLEDPGVLFDLRLAESARGRGLGVPVVRAMTEHVFRTYPHVTRFEAQTRDDNRAMRRVLVRAGFVKEAHYRDGWPVAGGEPRASVGYAVLRRDHESGTTTPVPEDNEA